MSDRSRHIPDATQEQKIVMLLLASWPSWTPAPVLSHISLQYSRAIHGLRRKGWQIENRVQHVNGVKHGFFRLARPGDFPNPKNKDSQRQERLFDMHKEPD